MPVLWSLAALHDGEGVPAGFVGVATDVSLKQVEDNLRGSEETLRMANRN